MQPEKVIIAEILLLLFVGTNSIPLCSSNIVRALLGWNLGTRVLTSFKYDLGNSDRQSVATRTLLDFLRWDTINNRTCAKSIITQRKPHENCAAVKRYSRILYTTWGARGSSSTRQWNLMRTLGSIILTWTFGFCKQYECPTTNNNEENLLWHYPSVWRIAIYKWKRWQWNSRPMSKSKDITDGWNSGVRILSWFE